MSNVRQLLDNGVPIYPITDKTLVLGLNDVPFEFYVVAWDGASTPTPANIPAGVTVTYDGNTYTGTLAASATTAPYLYLVASGTQQGEYDRYITTHTGSTYAWTALGSTAPVSPVIADDLVTNDSSKALSAKQGKILNDKTSELEAKVVEQSGYMKLDYSSYNDNLTIGMYGSTYTESGARVYRVNSIQGLVGKKLRVSVNASPSRWGIAFYTSNEASSSTFISASSVARLGTTRMLYEAVIPATAVCVLFGTTMADGAALSISTDLTVESLIIHGFGTSKERTVDQDITTRYLLDSIISEVSTEAVTIDPSKYDLVRGVVDAQGQFQSDSSRVIDKELIDIRGFAYISVTPSAGITFNIAYYNAPEESSFVQLERTEWITYGGEYRAKGKYMRIEAMASTPTTPMDVFDGFEIKGYSRIIENENYLDKLPASNYEGDFYPNKYTFVQGVLTNGELVPTNESYISSKDFLDVSGLRSLKIFNDAGYRSAVVLYDDNKNFVYGTRMVSGTSWSIDVGGYKYVKICIGKTDGSVTRDAETHISIAGIKEKDAFGIDVSELYVRGSLVNGAIQDATTRISTKNFIDVRNIDSLKVDISAGYYYAVVFYSGNSESSFLGGSYWSNIGEFVDVSKYNYARVTIRRSDNGDILATDGVAVTLVGYKGRTSTDNRTYNGARISLKNKMTYKSIWDKFSMLFSSAYSFDEETQQGSAIYNGYLFMLRHHAVVDIVNLNTMSFVNEYVIEDISAQKPHCNSGSFSKQYPSGNTAFPYLYTGRCAYSSDSQGETDAAKNACYVLNITTTGATLAQTITFANNNDDFYTSENGGAWDWVLDAERNILYAIGYGGIPRKYIVKGFNAPNPANGGTIALTDSDVIEQWEIPDNYINEQHAFQGATIYGNYFILPVSRGDALVQSEAIRIFDKYNHHEISNFALVEPEVGEAQSASVWNGLLWIVSKDGRLDCVDFDA